MWKEEYGESYAAYLQPVPTTAHAMHKCPMVYVWDDGLQCA